MGKRVKDIVDYDEHNKKPFFYVYGMDTSSIAMNKNIRNDIDKIYKSHKSECYNLAKKDFYYDSSLFKIGDIEHEEYCKKLLGIRLLAAQDEKIENLFIDMIKKEWVSIYNFIKNKDIIYMDEVIDKFRNIDGLFYENINIIYIIYICADIMGKNIVDNEESLIFKNYIFASFVSSLEQDDYDYLKSIQIISNESNLLKKFKYENFSEDVISKAKFIKNRLNSKLNPMNPDYEIIKNEMKLVDVLVELILETENFDIDFFKMSYELSEKDIEELYGLYFTIYRNQNIEEVSKFIVWSSILKMVLKAYKKDKKYYFENNSKTLKLKYNESLELIKQLENENLNQRKEIDRANKKINRLKNTYKNGLERENIELKKTKVELEKEIEELNKDMKELYALREAMFNREEEICEIEDIEIKVPHVNALVVGGHENWQLKLKKVLPDTFGFLNGKKENFDIRILDNVEYIFLNVNCRMNHGTYYKIINYVRNNDVELIYINSTNINHVMKEITSSTDGYQIDAEKAS